MKSLALAAVFAACAFPASAADPAGSGTQGAEPLPGLLIEDAYARASSPVARTGAAFFVIVNGTGSDDRLVAVATDLAERAEIHTHIEDAAGVMRMIEVEDGIPVPAGGTHALRRGGDHVMFMGLKAPFVQGETVTVTFTFEQAGDITVDIPVDLERMDGHGAHTN